MAKLETDQRRRAGTLQGRTTPPEFVEQHKINPVKWWAYFGAGMLALTAYSWQAWFFGGHAKATPTGPDPVPTWMVISIRLQEGLTLLAALGVIYIFVWRPWRRGGRFLTLDSMLIIAFPLVWALQDPLVNYTRPIFTYNAQLINLGCPQCHIPGWSSSKTLPEGLIWGPSVYIAGVFLGIVIISRVLRWAKNRWPQMGTVGLTSVAFLAGFIIDFVAENIWIRIGAIYTYPGSFRNGTFFHGHWYQFPIHESVFWGLAWGLLGCLRYFKNDKGETVVFKGIDRIRTTTTRQQLIRLLAVIGVMHMIFLSYNIPLQWWGTHSETWPQDIVDRSYFTGLLCGKGTNIACPGPRVPMPVGGDSARATPEGTFFAPKGLPIQVGPEAGGSTPPATFSPPR